MGQITRSSGGVAVRRERIDRRAGTADRAQRAARSRVRAARRLQDPEEAMDTAATLQTLESTRDSPQRQPAQAVLSEGGSKTLLPTE